MSKIILDNDNIYSSFDVNDVGSIHLSNMDLDDEVYTIIRKCINLKEIVLKKCRITTFESFLPIKSLYLDSCILDDLSFINHSQKLESLYFINCGSIDLKELLYTKDIRSLSLQSTTVNHIEYLTMMDSLQNIDICFSNVQDISAFAFNDNLQVIMMDSNQYQHNKKYLSSTQNLKVLNEDGVSYE